MKLNLAMNTVSQLKSKLMRQSKIVQDCTSYFEDEKVEYNFKEEIENYEKIQKELLNLKTKIQLTNAKTLVSFEGNTISLTQLIILNGEITAQLHFWQHSLAAQIDQHSYHRTRTKEEIKKVLADGFSKKSIEEKVQVLEARKQSVNSLIAQINLTTDLIK